jgi:MFS family permease
MTGSGEFRRGWPIVLACCAGIALGLAPIPFYEIGLFAPELSKAFGWRTGTIMAGVFFMVCAALIASPMVGFLADRYGARRVALTSIVCFGICLSLFSFQNGSLPFYYANWVLMAITGAGTLPITWTRIINQNFNVQKGMALAWALAGTGVSGFVLTHATAGVIAALGWRAAFLFLALMPLLIALPMVAVCVREPAGSGVRPQGTAAPTDGRLFGEAMQDFRFWLIGLGVLPVAFATTGPIANFTSILNGHGVDHETIVRFVPLVGLAVIAGRLAGGWLIDRVWAPLVAVGLFTVSAAATWLLVNGPVTPGSVLFGVLGVGVATGLESDLIAFLAARYFGARSYGSIYGTLYAFFGLGAGAAPLAYGRAFDLTNSFVPVVTWSAWAMFGGGLLLLFLGNYRYQPSSERAQELVRSD